MAPSTTSAKEQTGLLPLALVSPVDLGRMIRELEKLKETLDQDHLRGKEHHDKVLKTSELLGATGELNKIDFREHAQRQNLLHFLQQVREKAPLLHMSFSADPNPDFIEKIMAWLRREIHPLTLLTIGMQPNIGAGCVLRTTNHYFDFSLRKDLVAKNDEFMQALREAV
jgi:hypothetical protein